MANGIFAPAMKEVAFGNLVWKAAGGSTVRTSLVDTADYTVNLTTHNRMDDVAAAARDEESGNMTLIDAADDGILDANDVAFVGTSGDQCEGILLWRFVTNDADSWPFLWWDSAAGLPVTLGGDITVAWSNGADKIARI